MSERHRGGMLLGWPLSRASYPIAGLLVAVAVVVATRPLVDAPYATWPSASAAWHESLVLPGSLAAGISSWIGASLLPRRSLLSLDVRPRLGARAVTTHLVGLILWIVLGLVVGMAPVTIHALSTATWGHLRAEDVLVAVVGLGSVVAVAFTAGVVARSTLAAPVVALATFVVVNLPNSPLLRPLALVQPVQQWTASQRDIPNLAVSAFSLLAAVAGTLGAIAVADARLRARGRLDPGHLALVATPILLIVVAFAWRPQLYVDSGVRPEVCRAVASGTVCLHQAHARSLAPTAATVAALGSAGGTPLFGSVYDSALRRPGDDDRVDHTVKLEVSIPVPIPDQVAEQVSSAAQPATCLISDDPAGIVAYDLGGLVRYRLLVDAGYAHVADSTVFTSSPDIAGEQRILAAMSAEQFRAFVASHVQAISTCGLTGTDFVAP